VLLCYRFDHLNKGYSVNVLRVIQIGGIITLLLVGSGVGIALWRERRMARFDRQSPALLDSHDGLPSGGTA
jgi:protein SCO1/2